jgi:cell division protein FtsQ
MTLLLGIWLKHGTLGTEKWPIRWLELDGSFERVNAEQVRSMLATTLDTGFFAVDLVEVRSAASQVPWVADVQARKRWPDTVQVRILEYRPVAHWRDDQMISASGQAFRINGPRVQGLPELQGPEQRVDAVVAMWQKMNEELAPLGKDITRLELHQRGAWIAQLNNGVTLYLGREAVLARLQRFIVSWPDLVQRNGDRPVIIDLRYTNGFAVGINNNNESNA